MTRPRAKLHAFHEHQLFPATLTLICGILATLALWLIEGSISARAISITLVSTPVLASIGIQIRRVHNGVREVAAEIDDRIWDIQMIESEIGKTASKIENAFLLRVARDILKPHLNDLEELAGQCNNRLLTQGAYLQKALNVIDAMQAGDQILAICGDKEWADTTVTKFTDGNCAASTRGVKVERLFLEVHPNGFTKGEQEVIDRHWNTQQNDGGDITPLIVNRRSALTHLDRFRLPPDFGLTCLLSQRTGDKVLIHWGLSAHNPDGLWLESPRLVEHFKDIFCQFRNLATEYHGPAGA